MRKITALAALLVLHLCLPARSPAQWIDLTKPSEPRTPAVPEITAKITALTHGTVAIDGLAFSRDGNLLAVCGGTGDVPQVPRPRSKSSNLSGSSAAGVANAAADRNAFGSPTPGRNTSPSRRYLGRLVQESTGLLALETESGRLRARYEKYRLSCRVSSPVFAHDDKSVLWGSGSVVMVWSLSLNTISSIKLPDGCHGESFALSPTESKVVVRNWISDHRTDRLLYLLNAAPPKLLGKIEIPNREQGFDGIDAGGIDFSPDGKRFAVGFSLWDLESGKRLRELPEIKQGGEFGFVKHRTITFVPDGSFVVGHDRQNILIWDTKANQAAYAFQVSALHPGEAKYDGGIRSIAFSPDGKWIVAADDEVIHLWSFRTRKLVANLVGHVDIVNAVAFSPDGKTVASASSDGTTRLWDVSSVLSSISLK